MSAMRPMQYIAYVLITAVWFGSLSTKAAAQDVLETTSSSSVETVETVEALEAQITELNDGQTSLQANADVLLQKVDTIEAVLTTLEAELQLARDVANGLGEKGESQTLRLDAFALRLGSLSEDFTSMQETADAQEVLIKENAVRVFAIFADLEELAKQVASLEAEIRRAQSLARRSQLSGAQDSGNDAVRTGGLSYSILLASLLFAFVFAASPSKVRIVALSWAITAASYFTVGVAVARAFGRPELFGGLGLFETLNLEVPAHLEIAMGLSVLGAALVFVLPSIATWLWVTISVVFGALLAPISTALPHGEGMALAAGIAPILLVGILALTVLVLQPGSVLASDRDFEPNLATGLASFVWLGVFLCLTHTEIPAGATLVAFVVGMVGGFLSTELFRNVKGLHNNPIFVVFGGLAGALAGLAAMQTSLAYMIGSGLVGGLAYGLLCCLRNELSLTFAQAAAIAAGGAVALIGSGVIGAQGVMALNSFNVLLSHSRLFLIVAVTALTLGIALGLSLRALKRLDQKPAS